MSGSYHVVVRIEWISRHSRHTLLGGVLSRNRLSGHRLAHVRVGEPRACLAWLGGRDGRGLLVLSCHLASLSGLCLLLLA